MKPSKVSPMDATDLELMLSMIEPPPGCENMKLVAKEFKSRCCGALLRLIHFYGTNYLSAICARCKEPDWFFLLYSEGTGKGFIGWADLDHSIAKSIKEPGETSYTEVISSCCNAHLVSCFNVGSSLLTTECSSCRGPSIRFMIDRRENNG